MPGEGLLLKPPLTRLAPSALGTLSPLRGYRMHTSQLSIERRPDSVDQGLIRGGGDGDRCRTGAVWRPPPGKRGIALHAALVGRPCSCIRRLAGRRAQEV